MNAQKQIQDLNIKVRDLTKALETARLQRAQEAAKFVRLQSDMEISKKLFSMLNEEHVALKRAAQNALDTVENSDATGPKQVDAYSDAFNRLLELLK